MHDTSLRLYQLLYDITSRGEKYRLSLFTHSPLVTLRDVLEYLCLCRTCPNARSSI
jgi:hypothetical protein